ncbi:MAG: HDOD domain-containing protein [Thiobacillus sp.]|nr:HDOD domain-containing protein [Thiobacillus sp.]
MNEHTPLEPTVETNRSALDVLLRRMRTESDFPALSEAIGDINRIASSDREGVNELSNNILKDFALTNKLLKLANVAFYNQVGGGSISTISRAVVILGFDAVRSIALSLILFENLENKAHARHLKEEFVKVLYAGMLAREMAGKTQLRDVEEAFIGAMLHNLGRMLTMFYFPADTEAIGQLIETEGLNDARASARILGLSYENLGMGIARNWGFPDQLVLSMKQLPAGKIKKCASNAERLCALAGFSNELCDIVLGTPDADRGKALAALTVRYGDSVPVTVEQIAGLLERSMREIAPFAMAVNVNLKQSAFAQLASKWAGMAAAPGTAPAADAWAETDSDAPAILEAAALHEHAAIFDAEPGGPSQRTTEAVQSVLTAGLQDVSNSLIDDNMSVNDILRMILEAMYTGMGFAHVVLCIKDGRHNTMCGKFGFGDGVQGLIRAFDFSLAAQPDVFLVALQNNADILITDIDDPKIATRIPAWYRQHVPARTFVLFPIIVKGKPIGLIYADRPQPGDIAIPEKELSLLKSLRNQAVLAIRQSL